jgi:hypothetical protein
MIKTNLFFDLMAYKVTASAPAWRAEVSNGTLKRLYDTLHSQYGSGAGYAIWAVTLTGGKTYATVVQTENSFDIGTLLKDQLSKKTGIR